VLPGDSRAVEQVVDLIENAIAAAVQSYADSRDYQQQRREAEHIAFLTHELRNPLSVATLAASRLKKELGDQHRRELDLIERGHQRLRTLIDQVLSNERLELGEVEMRPADISLTDIIDNATRSARLVAAEKGVELDVSCDSDATLFVDANLLTSAVANLVDNAVKFTDHGMVEVVTDVKPDAVLIHVYDNCDGLSDDELRTIFQPFKRGHSNKPGSGLGLAIARRAVESHHGTLQVESLQTRGCHFWITLPRHHH